MRIGIDISQVVYQGTGVGTFVRQIVRHMIQSDTKHEYVLFAASGRRRGDIFRYYRSLGAVGKRVRLVLLPVGPTVLDILWNRLHIFPVEWFTGRLDIFWSSDWTQPPLMHARGVTTIHDLSFFRYPKSFSRKILAVQKRRLRWAKKECEVFFCDSIATQKDVMELLHIDESKLHVVYPGFVE